MLKIASILILLSVGAICFAQADFRFYVIDTTKNEKVHYESFREIAIYDFESQDPRFLYSIGYRIYGINQSSFSFTNEFYAGDLPRAKQAAILERARKLPLSGLDLRKKIGESTGSFGGINLDGKEHIVTATPDKQSRKQWQSFLDALIAEHAPLRSREVNSRTIEGDTVKPQAIDFATLLKRPKDYDGKRIKITGFYHGEFEGSSFAATKDDIENYSKALWLGGASTFADANRIAGLNDTTHDVEGTFELGPGGHMGLWMGELVRLTQFQPTKTEQGGVAKQAKPGD